MQVIADSIGFGSPEEAFRVQVGRIASHLLLSRTQASQAFACSLETTTHPTQGHLTPAGVECNKIEEGARCGGRRGWGGVGRGLPTAGRRSPDTQATIAMSSEGCPVFHER